MSGRIIAFFVLTGLALLGIGLLFVSLTNRSGAIRAYETARAQHGLLEEARLRRARGPEDRVLEVDGLPVAEPPRVAAPLLDAAPAPEGGFDVAVDAAEAGEVLGRRLIEEIRRRREAGLGWISVSVDLGSDPERGDRSAAREASETLIKLLRSRGVAASRGRIGGGSEVDVVIDARSDGPGGARVDMLTPGTLRRWTVLLDPAVAGGRDERDHHRHEENIRFATQLQLTADDARADALDWLAARVRGRIREASIERSWIGADQEARRRFDELLRASFSDEVLVTLGRAEIRSRVLELDGREYHRSTVSWAAPSWTLERVGESIARTIHVQRREPWIKGGISVALALLAVLSWFKVDWWLRGRHPLLTKAAFVTIYAALLGVVWTYEVFHG